MFVCAPVEVTWVGHLSGFELFSQSFTEPFLGLMLSMMRIIFVFFSITPEGEGAKKILTSK